jgi:hypothetical protein
MSQTRKGVPYQVYVPKNVRVAAVTKARKNGVPLNTFMVMAMEKFLERPFDVSLKLLNKHKKNRRKFNVGK